MNPAKYHIIIVTKDLLFLKQARAMFAGNASGASVTSVVSTADIQPLINKALPFVVVYDLDSGSAADKFLLQLNAMYRLLVLTTGSQAAPPPGPVNRFAQYIQKVRPPSPESAFYNSARVKINSYIVAGTPNFSKDAKSIADKDQKIIAIASSTGGPEALQKIFTALTAETPPIVVVQHMPSGFTRMFADRLNGICKVSVKEARHSDYLRAGQVLIAPAGLHMTVDLSGGKIVAECFEGPRMHGVIPAADILFDSVAAVMKSKAVGVILTGMGSDGARGLKNMREQGARTIGQDKASCVVYGMPKAAYELGAVELQLPLDVIADRMIALAR